MAQVKGQKKPVCEVKFINQETNEEIQNAAIKFEANFNLKDIFEAFNKEED